MGSPKATDSKKPMGFDSLSVRGQARLAPMHPYMHAVSAYAHDSDFVNLSIAENVNMWEDALGPKIAEVICSAQMPAKWTGYQSFSGNHEFREALAWLLQRHLGMRGPVDPYHLVTAAGAGAVLDMTISSLCDESDGVVITTPSYPGFDYDVGKACCRPVYAHHAVDAMPDVAVLEDAIGRALQDDNVNVKLVLICNPSNPTGLIMSRERVQELAEWAQRKKIHIIFDEIYALSVFSDGSDTDSDGDGTSAPVDCEPSSNRWDNDNGPLNDRGCGRDFHSVGELLPSLGEHVHIVYGLSKDFSLNGFRVGVLYSHNCALLSSLHGISYFCAVSSLTQYALTKVLQDHVFVDEFLQTARKRIKTHYQVVVRFCRELGVPFIPAQAGMFCLVNLSRFGEERSVWERMLHRRKVNLTPGESCHMLPDQAGWFRICFMGVTLDRLQEALGRIKAELLGLPAAVATIPGSGSGSGGGGSH